jgi:4'-phosphopantetheinyl transferase
MAGLRFPRRYFTLAAVPTDATMSPSPPFSTPGTAPRWHWQPWDGADRARPGAAWSAAHAWLASLPGIPPAALPMQRDAHGRPRFPAGTGADAGWSHSGDGLLVAFARDALLGVDMEYERPRPKALEIARRYFATAEVAWLASHPAASGSADSLAPRDLAFLRLWCAKEAVLKAHGRGLAFGLHRLAFAERDGALVLVEADAALGDPASWTLHEFAPHPGYRAALAWRPLQSPPGQGAGPRSGLGGGSVQGLSGDGASTSM